MTNQHETGEFNSAYNPFPEPRTIPGGWDVSVFSPPSQLEQQLCSEDVAED